MTAVDCILACEQFEQFEMVDEEYVEELKDKSENENTKNSTES